MATLKRITSWLKVQILVLLAVALVPIKRYAERNLVFWIDTAYQTQYRDEIIAAYETQ